MKRVLVLLLAVTIFILSACGQKTTSPQSDMLSDNFMDNLSEEQSVQLYPLSTDESVYDAHALIPEIIFSTTAEENGLSGTIYSFQGKMLGAYKELDEKTFFIIETEYGPVLMMNTYYDIKSEIPAISEDYYLIPEIGETARFTCIYNGFSNLAQMPSFLYGNDHFLLNTNMDTPLEDEQTTDIPDATEQTTIASMSYLAPEDWLSIEATNPKGWYYYPYENGADGLLYVAYIEANLIKESDLLDSTKTQPVLLSVLDGMRGESVAYDQAFLTVSTYPALVASYHGELLKGIDYEQRAYIILTPEIIYTIVTAEPQYLSSYLTNHMDDLVNSISFDTEDTLTATEPEHIHDFSNATCIAPRTCSCGETEGSTSDHTYENGKCSVCGIADPNAYSETLVWIPTKGGKKYHTRSSCSNMDDPEQVTQEEAERRGYTPCKRCH